MFKKKKKKKSILARKTHEAACLKVGMHTQFNSGSSRGESHLTTTLICLFVCLFRTTPRQLGVNGSNFHSLMG